jgi:hypothetical protein
MIKILKIFVTSVIIVVSATGRLIADSFDDYLLALSDLTENDPRPSVGMVASGFGASTYQFFAAASYSDRDLQTKQEDDNDGSIVIGLGLGDPSASFGTEVSLGITSVSTGFWGDGKFADEGNVNLKFHKSIKPLFREKNSSISIGASNLSGWGSTVDNPTNFYLAYSSINYIGQFDEYGLAYTLGYGTAVSNAETSGDLFGGFGIGRHNYSTSISFIGEEIHFSGNWYVPYFKGVVASFSKANIFNVSGNIRSIVSLGYSFQIGS